MTQLILYTTNDGQSQVQLRGNKDTAWQRAQEQQIKHRIGKKA